jgi:hypothetical protein
MKLSERISWTVRSGRFDETCSGSMRELLHALAGLQPKKRIPPRSVLNDILARGSTGAGGMGSGLLWDSGRYSLDAESYEAFCDELGHDRVDHGCEAKTVEEWQAWCYAQDHGFEYDVLLRLLKRLRELDIARAERDTESLHLAYTEALTEFTSYVNETLRSKE